MAVVALFLYLPSPPPLVVGGMTHILILLIGRFFYALVGCSQHNMLVELEVSLGFVISS